MTKEEILSNNILMADFMGYIHSEDNDIDRWEMNALKYHSSWNWLMIVVETIESLGYSFSIISNLSSIYENGDLLFERPHKEPPLSKLMSAYKVSIDFINWYNTKP